MASEDIHCEQCGASIPQGSFVCPSCGREATSTAPGTMPTVPSERPMEVTVSLTLILISGVLFLVTLAFTTAYGMFEVGEGALVFLICGAPYLILGILHLLIPVGLYSMMPWAKTAGLVVAIIGIIYTIIVLVGFLAALNDPEHDSAPIWGRVIAFAGFNIGIIVLDIIAIVFLRQVKFT